MRIIPKEPIDLGVEIIDKQAFNTPKSPLILNKPAKIHYNSLDGFRALAITIVIFAHLNFNSESKIASFFSGGFGVSIFFVISGFLITSLLLTEQAETGDISLRKFYARRSLRIFPVAYLFIVVMLIMNIYFNLHISPVEFYSAALYITNTSFLLTATKNVHHYWSYLGHFWSLSVEEQFYLLFPLLLKRDSKTYLWLIGIIIILIPPCLYLDVKQLYFFKNPVIHHFVELTRFLSGILIGSFVAVLHFKKHLKIPDFKYNTLLTITLFCLAASVAGNLINIIPTSFSSTISSILVVCMILINLNESKSVIYKILNSRLSKSIAVLSYSLYIWQQIFTNEIPWKGHFVSSGSHILNFFALILISLLSYYFYERHFLKLKKHFN